MIRSENVFVLGFKFCGVRLIEVFIFSLQPLAFCLNNRFAALTKILVGGALADIGPVTPAAFAPLVSRARQRSGRLGIETRGEINMQLTENENLLKLLLMPVQSRFRKLRRIANPQSHISLERVADQFLLPRGFDGLGDDTAQLHQKLNIRLGVGIASRRFR